MTLSIVARCQRTGQFGVAAATEMPAVGKLLSHAFPRYGAFATQALVNPYLGIDGCKLLSLSVSAQGTIDTVLEDDPERNSRQVAAVDREGRSAAFTGPDCLPWAGSIQGPDYSVQGNRLFGRHVLEAMATDFEARPEEELATRLIAVLAAGIAEGGDRHGESSANVLVMDREEYPIWDMRVDDHSDIIGELRRLEGVFREELLPHILQMPRRAR